MQCLHIFTRTKYAVVRKEKAEALIIRQDEFPNQLVKKWEVIQMGYIIRCLGIPFRIGVLVADLCNWVLNNFENDLHRQFFQDVLIARRITTIDSNIFPERHFIVLFLFSFYYRIQEIEYASYRKFEIWRKQPTGKKRCLPLASWNFYIIPKEAKGLELTYI